MRRFLFLAGFIIVFCIFCLIFVDVMMDKIEKELLMMVEILTIKIDTLERDLIVKIKILEEEYENGGEHPHYPTGEGVEDWITTP